MSQANSRAPAKLAAKEGYRADIQGLRGVAVSLVFLFHIGLPIPGGFLGVDMFFTISGFVITQLIVSRLETSGGLNLSTFFFRRFLRLAPALALVSVVTVVALNIFLTPSSAHADAAKTSIGASLIGANAVIAQVSGGYFGNAPGSNALLHTWSLSVEEQFYLLFPLLFAAVWALHRGLLAKKLLLIQIVIWCGAVLSFALTYLPAVLEISWGQFLFGYYSPVTRAWEFAVGSGTFLLMRGQRLSKVLGAGAGALGAVLVAVGATMVTASNQTPGLTTLLPTVGTCLILAAGSSTNSLLFRTLSAKPLTLVGDYSYSIYLWHWPILFLAEAMWPENFPAVVAGGALSLVLAIFSYRYIEQPLRKYRGPVKPRILLLGVAIVVIPISVSTAFLTYQDRYWAWLDAMGLMRVIHPGDVGFQTFVNTVEAESHECADEQLTTDDILVPPESLVNCRQSLPSGTPEIAIIGDSHGDPLFYGLMKVWPDRNIVLYTVVWEGDEGNASENSLSQNAQVLSSLSKNPQLRDVIVTGYWAERPYPTSQWDFLTSTLKSYGLRTHFTDDVPAFEFTPDSCKYGASWVSQRDPICDQLSTDTPIQEQRLQQRFLDWAEGNSDVSLLKTRHFFCDEAVCSMTSEEGELLYRDDDHLNLNGARYLGQKIASSYPWLAG